MILFQCLAEFLINSAEYLCKFVFTSHYNCLLDLRE